MWKNRRPIVVATFADNQKRTVENPRGWIGDTIKIIEGATEFALKVKAQGVYFKNIEGEIDHDLYGYIGQPYSVYTDEELQRLFGIVTKIGLDVGCLLRDLIFTSVGNTYEQIEPRDYVLSMVRKVRRMKAIVGERFKFVDYDSNVSYGAYFGEVRQVHEAWKMRTLELTCPDVLFMTEFWQHDYGSIENIGVVKFYGTEDVPALPLRICKPRDFNQRLRANELAAVKRDIKQGHIFLLDGNWHESPGNQEVLRHLPSV